MVTDRQRAWTATEYGGEEHERVWGRFVRRAGRWERRWAEMTRKLLEDQERSVRARLSQARAMKRTAEQAAEEPFDFEDWVKRFRERAKAMLKELVEEAGQEAIEALKVKVDFSLKNPRVQSFIAKRAQRFAKQVNETTWQRLRDTLRAGLEAGEGIPQLELRVRETMRERMDADAERIARTEVIGGLNGGELEGWRQSEVVKGKEWISALDDRTRTPPEEEFDHQGAHGEVVGLDEAFTRTGEELEYPGADEGSASNVINCRCTMRAVVE